MTPIVVQGMLGLGDNLHERAIVRKLIQQHTVWLETPWPSVFSDLVGPRLNLTRRPSRLRTQEKNMLRESALYSGVPVAPFSRRMQVWYTHDEIRRHGTFLAAMAANIGLTVQSADFALPIPAAWNAKADVWISRWKPAKPLMIYRPLVERTEWNGCAARNPELAAYAMLLQSIRHRFFVVSVADLVPGKEWIVGHRIKADAECHLGELDFETLAALTARAGLVFCSPGFAIIHAQAVGTPLVAVFGGHESARFYDHGDPRHLFIQPITPCECFAKTHRCDKRINMAAAERSLTEFCNVVADDRQIAA